MLTKSNDDIFENQKKLAVESTKKITHVDAKIDKFVADFKEMTSNMKNFMADFQTSSNKVIEGFRSSLQYEKEALSSIYYGLQRDNADHHTSIANSILRLQTDLAHENKIIDSLTLST
ncbi:unnamed protein product [Lactuca saligna]|uniref:Uncharacterized protein n=1 Tax=Lactuca saligna TaxID=75948 RepID=A0AA35Z9M2_LACSI|nr:unnamed protein product [Lactuca saligna]